MGRRLEMDIRDQDDVYLMSQFDGTDVVAFLIEQESGDIDRYLHVNGPGVLFHRLLFEDAQDVQGGRFGAAYVARASAARTGDIGHFRQRRTQPLSRQFKQAEA